MATYEGVPEYVIDGEIVEADPPRKLVQTWRMLMDAALEAEGFTRLTHEIEEIAGGACKLTVIHELDGAPKLAAMLAGDTRPRAPAAAGRGSSPTSSRCSRRASGWPTERPRKRERPAQAGLS